MRSDHGFIRRFYKKHIGAYWLQYGITIVLPGAIFLSRYLDELFGIPTFSEVIVGIGLAVLLAAHTILIADVTKEQTERVEYWHQKSRDYSWLLKCIGQLIHRKREYIKERGRTDATEYKKACITSNLVMLREFYTKYTPDPGRLSIKTVYFEPDETRTYLKPVFWYYEDPALRQPRSKDDADLQRVHFSRQNGMTLAAEAWREGRIKIAETPQEIHYTYEQQRATIKSMVAYPIFDGAADEANLIGLITVSSNQESFFLRSEEASHEEVIKQCAIRILFEQTASQYRER